MAGIVPALPRTRLVRRPVELNQGSVPPKAIGKLKRFKRVAMRCAKTDISCSAILCFARALKPVKSVLAAWRRLIFLLQSPSRIRGRGC